METLKLTRVLRCPNKVNITLEGLDYRLYQSQVTDFDAPLQQNLVSMKKKRIFPEYENSQLSVPNTLERYCGYRHLVNGKFPTSLQILQHKLPLSIGIWKS